MERENLYKLIGDTALLDLSTLNELEKVVKEYPYFHTARLLYTKNLDHTNNEQYGNELGKSAVLCADRRKLFYLIYRENYQRFLEQPQRNPSDHKDRTAALLDSFLTSLP